jgi:hypothetical protein
VEQEVAGEETEKKRWHLRCAGGGVEREQGDRSQGAQKSRSTRHRRRMWLYRKLREEPGP